MTGRVHTVAATVDAHLGARLRALRVSRGLSLRTTASQAGIAAGALSQIETGRNSPTVSTLRRVLGALGTTLGEFFGSDERRNPEESFIFRPHELVNVAGGNGIKFLALPGNGMVRAIQFLHETYAPGADTGAQPYTHEGEEGGFCVCGSIEITVGGRREVLGPGDAYYYSSRLPHRWRNVGRAPAVVISGCTPPTF